MASATKTEQPRKQIIVHCNGSGARTDGSGSGYAWIRLDTNEGSVSFVNGLTNNVAEYRAFLSALRSMPRGATVCICSASEVTCNQLNGRYNVSQPALASLHEKILAVERARDLTVSAKWIPKIQNLADRLLNRARLKP